MSSTVLAFAGAGDHVVMLDELYGGTHALATDLFDRLGIKHSFAATDANAVAQAVTPATRMIVIESPTNPLLGIIDIAHVPRIGKEHGLVTVIDNTFATPVNQRPLCLGIDVVMHSGTKYLGGHSDLCCGVAVTSRERAERIRNTARHLGGSLNAISCSLLERSLKTLAIRVERQTQNASRIAAYLATHDAIGKVNYPGPVAASHCRAASPPGRVGRCRSFLGTMPSTSSGIGHSSSRGPDGLSSSTATEPSTVSSVVIVASVDRKHRGRPNHKVRRRSRRRRRNQ